MSRRTRTRTRTRRSRSRSRSSGTADVAEGVKDGRGGVEEGGRETGAVEEVEEFEGFEFVRGDVFCGGGRGALGEG